VLGSDRGDQDKILFPSSSGAPVPVTNKDVGWLEEELDLVHRALGLSPPPNRTIGRDFLKGAEISWYELGVHCDVDRDLAAQLTTQIRSDLQSRNTVRINLNHAPGAGGTTLARRICWDFRVDFPCVRLVRTSPRETIERLKFLSSMTGLPILVVLDRSDVAEKDANELFDLTRAYHVPAVFLQLQRRVDATTGKRSFFLQFLLSSHEASRFAHILGREEPSKESALRRLEASTIPAMRNAFYFGLVAFEREFAGLDPYVRLRLLGATNEQTNVLLYFAFAHHFGQSGLPAHAFADILGAPKNLALDLPMYLTQNQLSLVLEDQGSQWRTLHELIALEIIEQVLSSNATDRRVWRYALAERAKEFALFLRGRDPDPSDALSELTRRIFLYRDNVEVLGKEASASGAFSRLIEEIPVPESAVAVLTSLTELYPEDPHCWAHLGRYYNAKLKDHAEALRCIDCAIALNDQDPVILHMKGMVLRTRTYALIDDDADVSLVIAAAQAASDVFQRTRALNPDAEHSYISEVQLVIKVLEYAARKQHSSTIGVLRVPGASPYLVAAIDLAETLLDGVRRIRPAEEPSRYEATCRNQLDTLYGDYQVALQAWDALLARADIYRPTVRRHIVWTHLARRGRSWDRLHPSEVDRINALLEENLREEQFDDRNLRLWLQAARRRRNPPTLDLVIERIAQWKANTSSLDATYYLYVCYALAAIEGSLAARESTIRFLDECRQRSRFRADRSKSFEWLGAGKGISKLVHQSALGDWGRFWSRTDRLVRTTGRITRIEGPQAGQITTSEMLSAFFVPGVGGFGKGRSENELVSFYVGFSYDGIRAWDVLPFDSQEDNPGHEQRGMTG
jgi:tetratricopeptide (TPR) repeat protein